VAAVAFSYNAWLARYPEFGGRVDSTTAQDLFNQVCETYIDNTDSARITDETRRRSLIWMLVAHLAELSAIGPNGERTSARMVGQMTGVSEGSVSISMGAMSTDTAGWWYQQTRYGAQYWNATARERLGRYTPGPVRLPRPANAYTGWPV
jgi:hypothetical protein